MHSPRTSALTLERASHLFTYNPETGSLLWRERPESDFASNWAWKVWSKKHSGAEAGTINAQGYRQIRLTVDGQWQLQKAHRIAWLLFHGALAEGPIDHINGNPSDNRISNLRTVDPVQNARNMKMSRRNKSGVIGVSWSRRQDKWNARIRAEGRYLHLGFFDTIEEAAKARAAAEKLNGYHPNHGRAA